MFTSIFVKFPVYINITSYFFYFTRAFQNNRHQFIYFTLDFIKMLFLYQFFIILSIHISLSLSSQFPQSIFLNLPPPSTKPSQRQRLKSRPKQNPHILSSIPTNPQNSPSLNINSSKPTKVHQAWGQIREKTLIVWVLIMCLCKWSIWCWDCVGILCLEGKRKRVRGREWRESDERERERERDLWREQKNIKCKWTVIV